MYSYSPKGFVTASTPASALVWETSLSKVHDLADEKLLQLSALQESVKPTYKMNVRDSGSTRPTSAPKNRPSLRKDNETSLHEYKSDPKLDALSRRLKLMDDKLKRSEKDVSQSAKIVQDQSLCIVQLRELLAADKRAIIAMQDSITNLNSQVGILAHKDEILERTLQKPHGLHLPQTIDVDAIKEVIFQRVQDEFGKVVQEVVKACAAEQAHFLSKWAERTATDSSSSQRFRSSIDDGHDVQFLEKEVAKLKAESARQKLRLDALESSHHGLKDLAKDKISAAEESQRRLYSSHKVEIQAMLDTVGRRFNELLNAADPSAGIQGMENEVKTIQKKIRSLESSYSSLQNEVTKLNEEGDAETKDDSAAASRLEVIRKDVEEKLVSIIHKVDDHILDSRKTITRLSESNKKTRVKVNDLASSLASVSQTRRSVELLLQEVDAKAHDDASWSYQFKTTTQKLDQRVSAIESKNYRAAHGNHPSEEKLSALETRLRDAESSILECQGKIQSAEAAKTAEDTYNASLINQKATEVSESVALELRSLQSRLADVESKATAAAAAAAAAAVTGEMTESIESRLQQAEGSIRDCIANFSLPVSTTNPPTEEIARQFKDVTSSSINDLTARVEALERTVHHASANANASASAHATLQDTKNEERNEKSTAAEGHRQPSPNRSRLQSNDRSSELSRAERPPRAPVAAEPKALKVSDSSSQGPGVVQSESSEGMAAVNIGAEGRNRGSAARADTNTGKNHASALVVAPALALAQKHSDHRRRFILDYCIGTSNLEATDPRYQSELNTNPTSAASHERRKAVVRLHKKKEAHRKRFLEMIDRHTASP